jgi:hypothetical protein
MNKMFKRIGIYIAAGFAVYFALSLMMNDVDAGRDGR